MIKVGISLSVLALFLLATVFTTSQAETRVQLTEALPSLDIIYNNAVVTIARQQNPERNLTGTFAITSRPCPPACISSASPADGINIIGELEVLTFMEREYLNETGAIIDARSPDWFQRGTIPGSINLPANRISADPSETQTQNLLALVEANERFEVGRFTRFMENRGWADASLKTATHDFTHAKKILIWDNGVWSDSAGKVIRAFVDIGYPAQHIYYYHGGMQSWQTLGITIIKP